MNAIVAKRLRNLRKQKNWSQEEVAFKLNISQSAYGRIEKGESKSWANHIEPICNLYEIEPEELIKQDNISISYNKGKSINGFIINQLSEKTIEQYEIRLKEKDIYIAKLEKELADKN